MANNLERLKELTAKLEKKIALERDEVPTELISNPKEVLTAQSKVDPKELKVVPKIQREFIEPLIEIIPIESPKPLELKSTRRANIERIEVLYKELNIFEKSPGFENIFIYKAMNLSGIGLKEEDFGEVREGKYIQVIAITYEPDANGKKKAKNISLGYFGKGDTIDPELKRKIIEFVLRWRYEKAFQNVQHYKELIAKLDIPK